VLLGVGSAVLKPRDEVNGLEGGFPWELCGCGYPLPLVIKFHMPTTLALLLSKPSLCAGLGGRVWEPPILFRFGRASASSRKEARAVLERDEGGGGGGMATADDERCS
jgi:hypothetical protein